MVGSNGRTHAWQPTTFLERGAAMPFTTPVLAGTRARRAAGGLELIVPHAGGGRGVYIMALSELRKFCAPTLHDTMLAARVAESSSVTPRDVRRLARAVAADGAAGRGAKRAALTADVADREDMLQTNEQLLRLLVQQTFGTTPGPADLEQQAKLAVVKLATAQGRPREAVASDVEALGEIYAWLGLAATSRQSRCARLLDAIESAAEDLKQFAGLYPGPAGVAATSVAAAAAATLRHARPTLSKSQARAGDLRLLLDRWRADAAEVAAGLARTDWMLNGWEQICLVWLVSERDQRRAAISEMALMVPAIPLEANDWSPGASVTVESSAAIAGAAEWRTGSRAFDLLARNERMCALVQ